MINFVHWMLDALRDINMFISVLSLFSNAIPKTMLNMVVNRHKPRGIFMHTRRRPGERRQSQKET